MQESVGSTLLPWQKKVKGQLHTYELSSESRLRPTLYETFLQLLIFSFDPFRLSVLSAIFYSRSSSVNDLQTHLHLGIDFRGQHLNYTLLLITLNGSVNKRKCQRRNQQGPGTETENLQKKHDGTSGSSEGAMNTLKEILFWLESQPWQRSEVTRSLRRSVGV